MKHTVLDELMDVQEAGALWGLSPAQVKQHCAAGNVLAKKLGNAWVIVREQPNPKKRERKSLK
jgi:hypothetical protein